MSDTRRKVQRATTGRTWTRRSSRAAKSARHNAVAKAATAALQEILSEACAWCIRPLPEAVVELPCTHWPIDDYWGNGALARIFIDGTPKVARINHETLFTGPNVTFVLCSDTCANRLEEAISEEWPPTRM